MACARCDFYAPNASGKAQLLEAKDNLQRMLTAIPLSDDERDAVDEGQSALDNLLERLIDVPTPTGDTPREIRVPATATLLPIVSVNQSRISLTIQIPRNYQDAQTANVRTSWIRLASQTNTPQRLTLSKSIAERARISFQPA